MKERRLELHFVGGGARRRARARARAIADDREVVKNRWHKKEGRGGNAMA